MRQCGKDAGRRARRTDGNSLLGAADQGAAAARRHPGGVGRRQSCRRHAQQADRQHGHRPERSLCAAILQFEPLPLPRAHVARPRLSRTRLVQRLFRRERQSFRTPALSDVGSGDGIARLPGVCLRSVREPELGSAFLPRSQFASRSGLAGAGLRLRERGAPAGVGGYRFHPGGLYRQRPALCPASCARAAGEMERQHDTRGRVVDARTQGPAGQGSQPADGRRGQCAAARDCRRAPDPRSAPLPGNVAQPAGTGRGA